ncbi:hypothetical protein HPB49_009456 [Dermacentor silvarum]|uniref:Uncharacterized protein n=1 Tax=Dermacentor silvarum TaxID=543639 RepID=A0ACB8DZE7_DERSI|nr:hypothetical protein HPB49_009456 [Dermacentor silvarum]
MGLRLNASNFLIAFDERKYDLDAYIRHSEGIASSQRWPEVQRSTALSTCLREEALSVLGRSPPEDVSSYPKVKATLLRHFRLTIEGFREKFRNAKSADSATAAQFSARLSHYFDQWI